MIGTDYWFFLGTIYLIILTWQDHKTMSIDDRKNFFMIGLTVSLISHVNLNFWYLISLVIIIQLLLKNLEKRKVFASGDTSALSWIMTGYGILNITYLIWFLIIFTIISVTYFIIKRIFEKLLKINKNVKLPFFGVILISFVITNIIFKLY